MTFQNDAFGPPFKLVECTHCHAWHRVEEIDADNTNCSACGDPLSLENAQTCKVPHAFRTNFRPQSRPEDADAGARHRSIQAEGKALKFDVESIDNGASTLSVGLAFDSGATTYRLNRGPKTEDGQGFDIRYGEQEGEPWKKVTIPHQVLGPDVALPGFRVTGATERIWLAAAKTTDSIYFRPTGSPEGLSLYRLPARIDTSTATIEPRRWLGVRAAALSATYLIANRAALALDIDPDEFDVLEPRIYGSSEPLPLLQITDHLVNGAGFCQRLVERSASGEPFALQLIRSMLSDPTRYPRSSFEETEHTERCNSACYKCLLRYGNTAFHGLIDWRLSLTYLRAMVDPTFTCGLDGDFSAPGLVGWIHHAKELAADMAVRFRGEIAEFAGVPAFRIDAGGRRPWVLVAHPLWDWDSSQGAVQGTLLRQAFDEASNLGEGVECWDTFNLSRRQVRVKEWLKGV